MHRVSLTIRMLILLPLVAAGIDLTRATAACGAQAQTCLEAAGRGWLGPVAVLLVVAYAAGGGILLARTARRAGSRDAMPRFTQLWAMATGALVAVTTGQDLVARSLGGADAALGGSPLGVLALCVLAGALLALVMRAAGHAADLLHVRAPRAPRVLLARVRLDAQLPDAPPAHVVRAARGRAPPAGR